MSHIACLCDNDVRENNPDVEHNFVSLALMAAHEEDVAFFELPYGDGEKAEVWLCDGCGRAIFFDDGGAMVTRIMRPEKPHPVDMGDPSVRIGYFYNEERFFDDDRLCVYGTGDEDGVFDERSTGAVVSRLIREATHVLELPVVGRGCLSRHVDADGECACRDIIRAVARRDAVVVEDAHEADLCDIAGLYEVESSVGA